MPSGDQDVARERRVVTVVAAVQFVNVLDFVIVMPMGPDFAKGLDIPVSTIGVVGGSYTLAAAVAGVIGSTFLDRFDRRKALAVCMAGLVVATASAGLATGLWSLVLARVLAGMFGGPATSIAVAAVTDTVPPKRRGRAMGSVMAAFSVASVVGVPIGLELARRFGWRVPFFSVAALGAVVTSAALWLMPSMSGHLLAFARAGSMRVMPSWGQKLKQLFLAPVSDPLARLSLLVTFLTTVGVFLIVPNIAAFVQYNRGYPRDELGLLYLVGGCFSFVAMKTSGKLVDRFGATPMVVVGSGLHVFALWVGFIHPSSSIGVMVFFVAYMLSGSVRMVPNGSLSTRVPAPDQRARFMSAQSAVQHTGSALGAMCSSVVLQTLPSGALARMAWIAWGALALALSIPLLVARLEGGVRRREVCRAETQSA